MANKFVHPNNIVPDKIININGVSVKEYLIKNHNINNLGLPTQRKYQLKGVTIHNTLTLGKSDDGKWYTASTINGNMGGVFIHYYVDCNGAWHNLDDTVMNWSCSDGIDYAGGNAATIAFEVIMDGTIGTNNSKALNNAARLAAYILYNNGLTANDLYTHSYWINTKIFGMTGTRDYLNTAKNTRKNCPIYIIPQWEDFKRSVDNFIVKLGGKSIYNTTPSPTTPTSIGNLVQYIYQATSTAAIRSAMNKNSTIYGRVTKGLYYPADMIYNNTWFKHTGTNSYSMLNDGGALFTKVGEYTIKNTTAKINVREKPTLNSDIVTIFGKGDKVYVWNEKPTKADGYTWYKCVVNNKIGYVAGEYLK